MDVDSIEEPEKRGLTKKKLTLAFDEYKRITNMIVVYMRSEEEKRLLGMYLIFILKSLKIIIILCLDNEDGDDGGILRSSLVNWYLEKIEDQINDESELLEKKSFIEKVLDRLIYNVC